MNLADVTVAIRPRAPWEAVDLGFRLVRAHAVSVWGAFLPCYGLFVVAACALFTVKPLLAVLLLWWFKPWYDRVVLHVLGLAVFGAAPRPLETLRAVPGLLRHGALASLTLQRFDAARALNLAPWQLEGLPFAAWRQRVRLLEASVRGTAAWLTLCCLWLEATLVMGCFALLAWLVPPELIDSAWGWLRATGDFQQLLAFGAWTAAVAIIEPFYVGAGFALYLNRRTQLEAWDLEIALRALALRQGAGG